MLFGRKQKLMPIPSHLKEMMRPLRRGNSEHGVTGNLVCPCGGKHFAVRADEEKNKAHIRCSACGREAVLFDATRHGWDGFVCHMPVEEMPEKGIVCEACGETSFYIAVSIRSQGRDDICTGEPIDGQ
jgi:ribosomal protein L37E